MLQFAPQCGDSDYYLQWGQLCASTRHYWHPIYGLSVGLFFSLPYRLGWSPATTLISINYLCIAASIGLAGLVMDGLLPRERDNATRILTWLSAAIAHLAFMSGDAWYSLSDVPAACGALVAVWLLLLGVQRSARWLFAASGAVLGGIVLFRFFYFYPALILLAALVCLSISKKEVSRGGCALFALCLFIPIQVQCFATYQHIGQWKLINPPMARRGQLFHITTAAYGFDTVLPSTAYFYDGRGCFKKPMPPPQMIGMPEALQFGQRPLPPDPHPVLDALHDGDYRGVACLSLKRQWFYFSTYCPHTYVNSLSERVFSPVILLLYVLAFFSVVYWAYSSKRRDLWALLAAFLGSTWACAGVLIPEDRFMMPVHVLLAAFGPPGAALALASSASKVRTGNARLSARRVGRWLPACLIAAVTIFLFHDFFFHGKAYLGGGDRLFSAGPFLTLAARSLARNRLPLWNDLNLSGCRGIGEAVNRALYPPTLLLLKLFPAHVALADTARLLAEVAAMLWIGYRFFLKVWEGDEVLALFSTLTYSLSVSSIMIFNFPFSAPYAPLLMLCVLWDWPARSMARNILGLALALALQVLGSSPQFSAYFILFVFAISAARGFSRRLLLLWAAAGILALLLCAPDLLPFLQGFQSSNRTALGYSAVVSGFQMPWYSVFRLLMPYFMGDYWQFPGIADYGNVNDSEFFPTYAGVAAFFFCLLALMRLKRKDVWPWAAGIALLALAAVRSPVAIVPYLVFLRSPLLHGRLVYLIPLCMAFLAPAGMRIFMSLPERERGRSVAAVFGLTLAVFAFASGLFGTSWSLAGLVGVPSDELLASMREAATVFGLLGLALCGILTAYHTGGLSARGFKLACLGLLAADLLYFATRHSMAGSFAAESSWHPANAMADYLRSIPDQGDYRFHMVMGTPWPGLPPFSPRQGNPYQPSLNIDYGLRDVNGYASFIDKRYAELMREGRPHRDPLRIPLGWSEMLPPRIADLLAVKYYVVPDNDPRLADALAGDAEKIFAADGAAVYRRRRPVGRFHLACLSHPAAQLGEALALVRSPSFDAAKDAVVEPDSGLDYDGSACVGGRELSMRAERPELFAGTARLEKPALLVVAETFDPGWRAWIDGAQVPLRRVNYAFMGVPLPAGTSRIELRFRPPGYDWALAGAATSAGALLALAFLGLRRTEDSRPLPTSAHEASKHV